ncbi:M23 family metallopeptidase [Treponema zioleckii]|uniref:M23 family metallopeptidase n=1 Tax=Treponema zioleckii TaxID=331680 RepID=UPI00168B8EA7|nr:M23 family metallopeptidase [Treponema zioleckii]
MVKIKKIIFASFFLFSLYWTASATDTIVISENDVIQLTTTRYKAPNPKASEEERKKVKAESDNFLAYGKEIEKSEKELRKGNLPSLKFYSYKLKKEDLSNGKGFHQLRAALSQNAGTLATVNRLSDKMALVAGQTILLPAAQGLYIAKTPETTLEVFLYKEYIGEITESTLIFQIKGVDFYYLPKKSFSSTDVFFFEDSSMILPLDKKVLTSPFGYRTSPISGKWLLHKGVDLAAPVGTKVYATKGGTVILNGYNEIYGNHVIIQHNNGMTSTYAHLSKSLVTKGQTVHGGAVIALTGNTGASTGPHLHFEIRKDGKPTDPLKLVK